MCFVWGAVKGEALELEEIRPQMEAAKGWRAKGDCCCFQSLSGLNGTLCDPVTAPHPTCVSEATVLPPPPCWRKHFRRERAAVRGQVSETPTCFLKQSRLPITFHCMCGFVPVPKALKTDSKIAKVCSRSTVWKHVFQNVWLLFTCQPLKQKTLSRKTNGAIAKL